jgi:hypothetical protein
MANRHSHKKLRLEARARMARTGESYQQARQRLLALEASESVGPVSGFELLEFSYFGKPAILASWHSYGLPVAIVISEAVRSPLMLPRFALPLGSASVLGGGK